MAAGIPTSGPKLAPQVSAEMFDRPNRIYRESRVIPVSSPDTKLVIFAIFHCQLAFDRAAGPSDARA